MTIDKFSDDCPGCRPAVLNEKTGQHVADDHPVMQAVLKMWGETTFDERKAYHAVICQNSNDPEHLKIVYRLIDQVQRRLRDA